MISGLVLKYLKGERLVMPGRYRAPCPVSSEVPLTRPLQVITALIEAGADGSLKEDYWDMTPFDYAKWTYKEGSNVYRVLSNARFR